MKFIDQLFDGPLDIIGDVHGEIDALDVLLTRLGYAADGAHPDGRRLVFLGDLTARGPDSPAVLKKVMRLVDAGAAQCILGNHELNLLRNEEKDGNSWWVHPGKRNAHPAEPVKPEDKKAMTRFLETLPVALEREDLRVVHACWNDWAIAELRGHEDTGHSVFEVYTEYADRTHERWKTGPSAEAFAAEWREHHENLSDSAWTPVYLPAKAQADRECGDSLHRRPTVVSTGAMRTPSRPLA